MRFIVGDRDNFGEQEEGEQGQAREEKGREPEQKATPRAHLVPSFILPELNIHRRNV